ncbi:unnamed protein product [Amoebophrya sp. A120]|nr:unnamed protein product [Amoebophrya sp. A120]|eukprot:GSA120T00012574001.1
MFLRFPARVFAPLWWWFSCYHATDHVFAASSPNEHAADGGLSQLLHGLRDAMFRPLREEAEEAKFPYPLADHASTALENQADLPPLSGAAELVRNTTGVEKKATSGVIEAEKPATKFTTFLRLALEIEQEFGQMFEDFVAHFRVPMVENEALREKLERISSLFSKIFDRDFIADARIIAVLQAGARRDEGAGSGTSPLQRDDEVAVLSQHDLFSGRIPSSTRKTKKLPFFKKPFLPPNFFRYRGRLLSTLEFLEDQVGNPKKNALNDEISDDELEEGVEDHALPVVDDASTILKPLLNNKNNDKTGSTVLGFSFRTEFQRSYPHLSGIFNACFDRLLLYYFYFHERIMMPNTIEKPKKTSNTNYSLPPVLGSRAAALTTREAGTISASSTTAPAGKNMIFTSEVDHKSLQPEKKVDLEEDPQLRAYAAQLELQHQEESALLRIIKEETTVKIKTEDSKQKAHAIVENREFVQKLYEETRRWSTTSATTESDVDLRKDKEVFSEQKTPGTSSKSQRRGTNLRKKNILPYNYPILSSWKPVFQLLTPHFLNKEALDSVLEFTDTVDLKGYSKEDVERLEVNMEKSAAGGVGAGASGDKKARRSGSGRSEARYMNATSRRESVVRPAEDEDASSAAPSTKSSTAISGAAESQLHHETNNTSSRSKKIPYQYKPTFGYDCTFRTEAMREIENLFATAGETTSAGTRSGASKRSTTATEKKVDSVDVEANQESVPNFYWILQNQLMKYILPLLYQEEGAYIGSDATPSRIFNKNFEVLENIQTGHEMGGDSFESSIYAKNGKAYSSSNPRHAEALAEMLQTDREESRKRNVITNNLDRNFDDLPWRRSFYEAGIRREYAKRMATHSVVSSAHGSKIGGAPTATNNATTSRVKTTDYVEVEGGTKGSREVPRQNWMYESHSFAVFTKTEALRIPFDVQEDINRALFLRRNRLENDQFFLLTITVYVQYLQGMDVFLHEEPPRRKKGGGAEQEDTAARKNKDNEDQEFKFNSSWSRQEQKSKSNVFSYSIRPNVVHALEHCAPAMQIFSSFILVALLEYHASLTAESTFNALTAWFPEAQRLMKFLTEFHHRLHVGLVEHTSKSGTMLFQRETVQSPQIVRFLGRDAFLEKPTDRRKLLWFQEEYFLPDKASKSRSQELHFVPSLHATEALAADSVKIDETSFLRHRAVPDLSGIAEKLSVGGETWHERAVRRMQKLDSVNEAAFHREGGSLKIGTPSTTFAAGRRVGGGSSAIANLKPRSYLFQDDPMRTLQNLVRASNRVKDAWMHFAWRMPEEHRQQLKKMQQDKAKPAAAAGGTSSSKGQQHGKGEPEHDEKHQQLHSNKGAGTKLQSAGKVQEPGAVLAVSRGVELQGSTSEDEHDIDPNTHPTLQYLQKNKHLHKRIPLCERLGLNNHCLPDAAKHHYEFEQGLKKAVHNVVELLDELKLEYVPIGGTLISALRYGRTMGQLSEENKVDAIDDDIEFLIMVDHEDEWGDIIDTLGRRVTTARQVTRTDGVTVVTPPVLHDCMLIFSLETEDLIDLPNATLFSMGVGHTNQKFYDRIGGRREADQEGTFLYKHFYHSIRSDVLQCVGAESYLFSFEFKSFVKQYPKFEFGYVFRVRELEKKEENKHENSSSEPNIFAFCDYEERSLEHNEPERLRKHWRRDKDGMKPLWAVQEYLDRTSEEALVVDTSANNENGGKVTTSKAKMDLKSRDFTLPSKTTSSPGSLTASSTSTSRPAGIISAAISLPRPKSLTRAVNKILTPAPLCYLPQVPPFQTNNGLVPLKYIFPLKKCRFFEKTIPCPHDPLSFLYFTNGGEYFSPEWNVALPSLAGRDTRFDVTKNFRDLNQKDLKILHEKAKELSENGFQSFLSEYREVALVDDGKMNSTTADHNDHFSSSSTSASEVDSSTNHAEKVIQIRLPSRLKMFETNEQRNQRRQAEFISAVEGKLHLHLQRTTSTAAKFSTIVRRWHRFEALRIARTRFEVEESTRKYSPSGGPPQYVKNATVISTTSSAPSNPYFEEDGSKHWHSFEEIEKRGVFSARMCPPVRKRQGVDDYANEKMNM